MYVCVNELQQAKDIAYDPKKAAEKKARKAAKEAEAALLAERELLYSGAAAAKKKEEAEPKTTKQLMEEYEYDVSVQKLSLPINVGGRFTVEQEIEEERAKLRNPDSVPGTPIEKEWFDQWSASLRAERARAGFGKRKKDEAARRPAVLTGRCVCVCVPGVCVRKCLCGGRPFLCVSVRVCAFLCVRARDQEHSWAGRCLSLWRKVMPWPTMTRLMSHGLFKARRKGALRLTRLLQMRTQALALLHTIRWPGSRKGGRVLNGP